MVRRLDKKFNLYRYPGDEYRHLICDICGKKRFLKDMKHIDSQYNRANGLTVCKEHDGYTDVQPQDIPIWIQPDIVDNPDFIRVRPERIAAENEASNQLPTAPQQLGGYINPINGNLVLRWLGPSYPGSSPITSYIVSRLERIPQIVTLLNTNSSTTTFEITNYDIETYVIYKVAAVNKVGQGPYSNIFYWPSQGINVFLSTESQLIISTESNLDIQVEVDL